MFFVAFQLFEYTFRKSTDDFIVIKQYNVKRKKKKNLIV